MHALLLASLIGSVVAAPTSDHHISTSNCFDFTANVPISTQALKLPFPPFTDGYQAVQLAFDLFATRPDAAAPISPPTPYSLSTTFAIDATYCAPTQKGTKGETVQVLTHGLGFDKRYTTLAPQPHLMLLPL